MYVNQQNAKQSTKTQTIKHTSCPAPTPSCFDTKVPSSGSFLTAQDRKSNLYTFNFFAETCSSWHLIWYLLTAVGLPPGGSTTVHIYTQTIHRTTQITTNLEECGPCPVFAFFTLAFALQLRKKHGKTSVNVRKIRSVFNGLCYIVFHLRHFVG